MKRVTLSTALLLATTDLASVVQSFTSPTINPSAALSKAGFVPVASSSALPASRIAKSDTADPNKYNIPLSEAADLWTCSVQESNNADRLAGVPYVDSKSKDYFVDDILSVEVSRDGGLGIELLELAGGRDDGVGVTIVSAVTEGGNAQRAGLIPGDSIAGITVLDASGRAAGAGGVAEETRSRSCDVEARDFDGTIGALGGFPGEGADRVYLDVKRIRRWPKVRVQVVYPASQCAEGFDPVKDLELFAGENLKAALQNRGIVLSDPAGARCDFCGSKACYVSVFKGKELLNPMGVTEEKLMENNQNCRLSCKTIVGYNMQEGELKLKVNLSQQE